MMVSAPDSEAQGGLIVLDVAAEEAGERLDQWLAAALGGALSRSRVQALIKQGAVSVGGSQDSETSRKVAAGDSVTVAMPEPQDPQPKGEAIPLDILYEDAELIVVNKPPGLVVHPGAGNWTGTLVNALIHHCGDSLSGIGGVRRPGIVHRLDKDTSGVMVVAKTDPAHRALSDAFADHGRAGELERAYQALVWGAPARNSGSVDAPLGRARDRVLRAVVPEGRDDARHAVTHYTVLERFPAAASEAVASSGRMPAGDRPHPPDPRPYGAYRPSGDRRSGLRQGISHQGRTACPSRCAPPSPASRARRCMQGCLHFATREPI